MRRFASVALIFGFASSLLLTSPVAAVTPATAPTLAPTIQSPASGANVGSTNPILTWTQVSGAAKYRVQVFASPTYSGTALFTSDTPTLNATPTNELPFGTLYWQVAGLDSTGNAGPWAQSSFVKDTRGAPTLVAPTDGRQLEFPTDPVLFSWNPVPGAASYTVQISPDSSFTTYTSYVTTNTSYALTDTQAFTMSNGLPQAWYWRVQATLQTTLSTQWSSVRSYTIHWSATPTLRSPANGATNVTEVAFSWDAIPGAAKYEIQVSPNGDWQNGKVVDATVASTRFQPYPTLPNQGYYWRVQAIAAGTANNRGAWSTPFTFNRKWEVTLNPAIVAQPVVVSSGQFNGTNVPKWDGVSAAPVVTNVELDWTPAANTNSTPGWIDHADHYEIWLSRNSNFSSGIDCMVEGTTFSVYKKLNLTNVTYPEPCDPATLDLTPGVWYWRVRGVDGYTKSTSVYVTGRWDADGENGTPQKFDYEPNKPTKLTPANGASVWRPVLSWTPVAGAVKYHVLVWKNGNFSPSINIYTYATSYTPTILLLPTEGPFTWRVSAVSAVGSEWADLPDWQFDLVAPPSTSGTLDLVAPAEGSASIRFPSLQWQPLTGASYYVVMGGTSLGALTAWSGSDKLYFTAFTYKEKGAGTFYWEVWAYDSGNHYLTSSSPGSFIVGQTPAKTEWFIPWDNYLTPECSAQTDPASPAGRCVPTLGNNQRLRWVPDDNAGAYIVYIAKDPHFTTIYRWYYTVAATFTAREPWLDSQAGESYYWYAKPCVDAELTVCGPDPSTAYGLNNASAYRKQSAKPTGLYTTTAANPPVTVADPGTIKDQITFHWNDYMLASKATGCPQDTMGHVTVTTAHSATNVCTTQEAMEYEVTVATSSDFSPTSIIDDVRVETTQYTPWSKVYPDVPLWWKVQAVDSAGNQLTASDPRKITKKSDAPALIAPSVPTVSGVPFFQWGAMNYAAGYQIELYRGTDTLSAANRVWQVTTVQTAWTPTNTLPSGVYSWHVRRVDYGYGKGVGYGPWSDSSGVFRTFTLQANQPTLTAPADQAIVAPIRLLFTWVGPANAVKYKIEVSSHSDLTSPQDTVSTVMSAWAPTRLYADGTWYWRVSVLDASGNVLRASSVRRFTVGTPPPPVGQPATYFPITPVRIVDTRTPKGLTGKIHGNTPATFLVAGATGSGIPVGATAVTGNVTVTNPTNAWALFLGPDPNSAPTSSTINFSAGATVANAVTVALSTDGHLSATYMTNSTGQTTDMVFDVTGYFMPNNATGDYYHSIAPIRVVDTRLGKGIGGGHATRIAGNTSVAFQVAGAGGVLPASAVAVTGNATVVNADAPWALYVGPSSGAPTTSTVNFVAGEVKANSLSVALTAGGQLYVRYITSSTSPRTDFVFDVTGYYTATSGGGGLRFVPMTPARVLDTRNNTGLTAALLPFAPKVFGVAGVKGVAASALCIAGNLTVTGPTDGYALYVGPDSAAHPTTSNINFVTGETKANGLTVSLTTSPAGKLYITYMSGSASKTDAVLDVTGYFIP